MYAILDIETTGLSPSAEKITEIAIFIHDGKKVVDRFSTLLNPEKKIPYRIIQMTGINNQMVEHAPKFYEVAKRIVELTDNKIVVGHNVRFDYGFIRNEFKSLGFDFQRKTIDTVKLSRKLIPGKPSYSLGKLCQSLGIEDHSRHRAEGDALATVKLFEMLLSIDRDQLETDKKGKLNGYNKSLVEGLPKAAGVYYFYNKSGELIYVGKSINIHDRVLSHLNNNLHKKAVRMKNEMAEVDFQLTGNELVALLLESAEIKKHQPLYNRAQRRTYFNYGLYPFTDENGYTNLKVIRILDELNPVYTYGSSHEGKEHLTRLTEEFGLCQKLCGLYDTKGSCFQFQIHQCEGACIGKEEPESYNRKVGDALENYHFGKQNFFVVEQGRSEDEKAIVKVENGKYIGFGFVGLNGQTDELNGFHECIRPQKDNREVRQIINSFLRKNNNKNLIPF
ncbi:MAG: ribonuclease H-like domain-containing protein [Bacteroidales bacterium]|nr:ribonuclease H-like domain-containing protein [Bacteroidales bacterium]